MSRQSSPSAGLRTAAALIARSLRGGPVGLRDRFNIWTTIGYSLVAGDRRPFYYVLGYPKTGTNWVCKMLSAYLGIPVHEFWASSWPQFSPAVVHMHRFLPFDGPRRRTLYVLRDGRDIVVSDYHHRMRDREADPALAEELNRYLGAGFDPEEVSANLPGFIRYLIDRRVASTDYVSHVGEAFAHPYVRVRYEDLLRDAPHALGGALTALLEEPPDEDRLHRAIDAESFAAVTGRASGTEDRSAFVRKGVAGDWRTVLTREAAECYDAYAGETLILAGYEPDHSWVSACSA